MIYLRKISIILLVLKLISTILFSEQVKAITLSFQQTGFTPGGGLLTGQFGGNDDGVADGTLSLSQGEITAFSLEFSGNNSVPDFTASLGNVTALSFDLSTNMFNQLGVSRALTQFTTATISYPLPAFFTPDVPTTEVRTGSLGGFPRATFSTAPIQVPELSTELRSMYTAMSLLILLGLRHNIRRKRK